MFIANYDKLFDYIRSIAEAVKPLLFQDNLRQISVIICSKVDKIALEKITLRLSSLNPKIVEAFRSKSEAIGPIDKVSLESIIRSFLIKLSTADTYFKPLPNSKRMILISLLVYLLLSKIDITFYVIIETHDELNPSVRDSMQNDLKTVYICHHID